MDHTCPALGVRLLGGFSISRDGESLLTVRTARLQSLFAYLLLHGQEPISRKHLAFLMWPDSSEAQALGNLRKHLHDLRQALGDWDYFPSPDTQTIRWNPGAPLDLDVASFDEAAARARTLPDLQQAAELYHGDLLPACYDEWIAEDRERLRQKYLDALERLVALLEAEGEYRAAVAYGRRQLQLDPLREETYRELMRLSALSGNRAQVASFHETCAAVLRRELGVEPSAETVEMYTRCLNLASQPRAARSRLPATLEAAPVERRPNNLPFQLTRLIGRDNEREELRRLVSDNRWVTLTGAPGVGKTRLAIQVAADMLHKFADGAWFVGLATLRDPKLVVPTIAGLFGLKEAGALPVIDLLKRYLGNRELLLVLDNFEQVADASVEILELLGACPRLRVLVTSRKSLPLSGEREYPVHPLALPMRDHTGSLPAVDTLAQCDSIRLFVDRAQDVMPDFGLDDHNAEAVAEICVRLDGLPLAIQLVAARVRMFSPQTLLGRLEHNLQLLTTGERDVPARHRTLMSAIEWSHGLLSESKQQLFRRLAVFSGGATLDAVERVCQLRIADCGLPKTSGPQRSEATLIRNPQLDVLDGLEALVEHHLVEQREGRSREPRFWMLETIHEFAREKLEESDEGDSVAVQHAAYFLALAEEAEPHLRGAGQMEWLDRLEEEHDNIRAALRWAQEKATGAGEGTTEALETGLRIAAAISRFWYTKGYYSEGRGQIEKLVALAAVPGGTDDGGTAVPGSDSMRRAKARALREAGWLAHSQGDHEAACALLDTSLALNRQLGNRTGTVDCLIAIGIVALSVQDFEAARVAHEEGLAISREAGYRWGIARSLLCLGNVGWNERDYDRARCLYEEGIAISEETGDRSGVCVMLYTLAGLAFTQGDYGRARLLYEQSLAISRELGFRNSIAIALRNLGYVALMEGDARHACSLLEESLAAFGGTGDKPGVASVLVGLGGVLATTGQARRGASVLGAAEALMQMADHSLHVDERVVYDFATAAARRQLGDEVFHRAWQEGRTMTEEEATAEGLEPTPCDT